MDWWSALKYIALLLVAACASCKPTPRSIEICEIFAIEGIASCARRDKKWETEFPEKVLGYIAFHEESLNLLGARLEECEQVGRLPRGDDTWNEMNTCVINRDSCGATATIDMDYYFAIPVKEARKIIDRLEFCKRQ